MSGSYGGHAVGEVVSNKILLSYCGLNAHSHHTWNWKCLVCGSEFGPSTFAHIKRSSTCKGCRGENRLTWRGYKEISGTFINQCKWNANKRNIVWGIDAEYLWLMWEKQQGRCAYSNIELNLNGTASVDRIDNTKGYVYNNVQWVHKDVNKMKTDFTEKRFLELCNLISHKPK